MEHTRTCLLAFFAIAVLAAITWGVVSFWYWMLPDASKGCKIIASILSAGLLMLVGCVGLDAAND